MTTGSSELVLTNARVVTADDCFAGTVAVAAGSISTVERGRSNLAGVVDLEGDYLIPGLVELHTDGMERHFVPRPGVTWPRQSAILAHDAQLAASGITTVLDAVAVGDVHENSPRVTMLEDMCQAINAVSASGLARAEHFLHLRCELTFPRVVENFAQLSRDGLVRLVSIMDHTPGQRQFVDIGKYRVYYQGKYHLSDREIDAFITRQRAAHEEFAARHRSAILELCRARRFPLASHDDATVAHVDEAVAAGAVIAEFPTTIEAAEAAHRHDLKVLMGGPNLVLGGSHSGNISAAELAQRGLLDIVSSDYVPSSLLHSAFALAERAIGLPLPEAIAKVSKTPARLVGLDDRGAIAPGERADLIWVKRTPAGPVTRAVWREGRRIA
jgi:alpha-D-ribose 1-methylphosphonate 5-triphosphate diphosphatase